jgi:hypothetical protein
MSGVDYGFAIILIVTFVVISHYKERACKATYRYDPKTGRDRRA